MWGARYRRVVCALVLGIALTPSSRAAETLTNEEFNFTLSVPNGFIRLPNSAGAIYTFATSDPQDGVPDVTVSIQSLDAEIGREPLKRISARLPGARVTPIRWKTFDVELVSYTAEAEGIRVATRSVQLPIKGRAIQIVAASPNDKTREASRAISAFVAGLDGRSNWRTQVEQRERVGYALVIGVLAVGVLVVLVRRANRRSAPGGAGATADRYMAASSGSPGDTYVARHRRALRVALFTVLAVFVLMGGGAFAALFLGLGAPLTYDNAGERIIKILSGLLRMCAFGGLLGYGVARLFFRLRHGRPHLTPSALPDVRLARDARHADAAAKLGAIQE
jgi:hypothetical protein